MTVACGVDIIYIPTIEKLLKKENQLKEFFDVSELDNTTAEHLAGILVAKEAFFKALGQIPHFGKVTITFGKPVMLDYTKSIPEITQEIQHIIEKL